MSIYIEVVLTFLGRNVTESMRLIYRSLSDVVSAFNLDTHNAKWKLMGRIDDPVLLS